MSSGKMKIDAGLVIDKPLQVEMSTDEEEKEWWQ
jgi:hypothetical protein